MARAPARIGIPIPRMTNTFIDNGKDKPEDILSSTKKGIYVQSLSGGSVNPVTGVFNFTCREAYMIENGKKTNPTLILVPGYAEKVRQLKLQQVSLL